MKKRVLDLLKEKGMLQAMSDGRTAVRIAQGGDEDEEGEFVTIARSDGSSLYITRDIAAVIDRSER